MNVSPHVIVVAEIGINHEGNFAVCMRMVDAAASAGADAIKLQTVDADRSYDPGSPSYELFKRSALTREQTAAIFARARELGLKPFTTAVDPDTIDWVDRLEPYAHKVSSGLLTTTPVLRHLARKRRPVVLSTGMAEEKEIAEAVAALREAGCVDLVLLQCTSLYPAPDELLNLAAIPWLRERFDAPTGFSDHSVGTRAAMLSVAYGAVMIEKHFTLDPTREGFDHRLSLGPEAFGRMVVDIRAATAMVGTAGRILSPAERDMRRWAHRVLVAAVAVPAGALLSPENVIYRRPPKDGPAGLRPGLMEAVYGHRARTALRAGQVLRAEDIDGWQSEGRAE
jgi:N,N'-diacetyllegionaminate synthase